MTAEILSLDGARISAREVIPAKQATWSTVERVMERLARQVQAEAIKTFNSNYSAQVYVTYEVLIEVPEPGTAA